MIYAYKENNEWIFPVSMRSRFKGISEWHTLTDKQRAEYGWYPCELINASFDPRSQERWGPFTVKLDPDGVVRAQYVITAKNKQKTKEQLRARRNTLLAECDWTQLQDSSVDKDAWAVYRQALRDLPQQEGFPFNVEFPTPPE